MYLSKWAIKDMNEEELEQYIKNHLSDMETANIITSKDHKTLGRLVWALLNEKSEDNADVFEEFMDEVNNENE